MSSAHAGQFRHPWLGVEFRHLAALAAIARERSFSGAAEELGYVQSAISQQIAQLERVVGARVVERARGHRGVELTPPGLLLAEHARTLLEVLQAARIDLESALGARDGTIRAGMGAGIVGWLLPPTMAKLAERMPDVRLEVVEPADDDALACLVEAGKVDVALGPIPSARETFEVRRVLEDPYVLVVPSSCQAAGSGRLPAAGELGRYRLFAPPRSRDLVPVETQLEAYGIAMTSATRLPLTPGVQAMVAAGEGMALMPGLLVDPADPRTRVIELGALVLPRVISVYWHRWRQTVEVLEDLTGVVVDCIAELEARDLALAA